MILSIHQPSYFPWLGLLQKIAKSDVFILLDEVQLTDSAFQHRNLLLTNDGKAKFLTIPFVRKGYLEKPFSKLEIPDQKWQKTHLNFVFNNYKKHPFFSEIFPMLEVFYSRDYENLLDAVRESMFLVLDCFKIKTEIIYQSNLSYAKDLKKGDLIMNLINCVGADIYLSGQGAKSYLDESAFGKSVLLEYDEFKHPIYNQKNVSQFVAGLSSLDILFNLGCQKSIELFMSEGKK